MTSFPTTGPITASLDIEWGDIRIVAGGDGPTVVEVTATDPTNERDRRAADATAVSCTDGTLRVVGPRNKLGKKYGSVQVAVQLATGSELDAQTGLGGIVVEGRLGACRAKTGAGDLAVQDAASADLRTGLGSLVAGDIGGDAYCSTGSGSIRIERVGGRAEVKNSNGGTRIGDSGGPLRVKAANGAITVDRSRGDLHATSANGDLRVGSAERGSVELKTSLGRIEVGILAGTPALLDLKTSFGVVRSDLDAADQPTSGEGTVQVHAQTSAGDIDILRATVGDE